MTDMNARLMALAASYADESKWRWRVDEDSVFPLRALTIELEGCRVEISEMYGLDDEVRGYMWLIAPNDREEIDSDLGQAAFTTIAEAKADAFDMLVHCVQTQDEVAAATAAARAAFARCCVLLTDLPPLQKWRVLAALRNWVNETTKNDPFIEQKRNEAFSVGDVYDEPNLSNLSL